VDGRRCRVAVSATIGAMEIRVAAPEEYAVVGELTVREYVAGGHVPPASPYVDSLRDAARRAEQALLLVAVEDGAVLGSVAFTNGGQPYANIAAPGEAEFRTLVVAERARRRGIGEALVRECVRRAREAGATALRLSSGPTMTGAHRMYDRLGFTRTPDRDWTPESGGDPLLTYELDLAYCDRCGTPAAEGAHQACRQARELEPPRWCSRCRRRMVVQVTPTGWTARCVEHGELVG
jgi:ribosomal protein S18 acetylase RimI-like enzyme